MVSCAGLSHELILVQTVADTMPGTLSHLPVLMGSGEARSRLWWCSEEPAMEGTAS